MEDECMETVVIISIIVAFYLVIFFNENLKEKYGATSGEVIESPIKGTHGNTEYLWYVRLHKAG